MNRGFEDWFFSGRGKEKKIVEHLARFLKSKTSSSEIFTLVRGFIKPNSAINFSPDIDVLEIDSNKKLIAYEIKLLKGKKAEYFVMVNLMVHTLTSSHIHLVTNRPVPDEEHHYTL